jgi:putative toxin-antitoxin system antitoxin component (TIGR02293 family)
MAVSPTDILGGEKILGKKTGPVIERIRAGLPYASLERVQQALSLSREETAFALSIPLRTLARRKREGRLGPDESDRLFRIARVFAHAAQIFGNPEWAAEWFRASHLALGMETPLSRLDTDPGVIEVDEILGHIEHGVYS